MPKHHDDLTAHLADVPLFSKCSRKDLAAIAKHTDEMTCAEGTAIVTQGQVGDAFYVVIDGEAHVRRNGRKVGEVGPGGYFGELALLDPAPRNADVVAQTPVTVARLRAGDFRDLLHSVPALSERLLAGLARRVRDGDRKAVE
jgi:CRP/FNR family transcriptional regulator